MIQSSTAAFWGGNRQDIDLAGHWQLADLAGDYACKIALPGDGVTALHAAGLIPDPYFGRNEYDLRWIAERDWRVTRQVTLTATDVDLVVEGLDTLCILTLNGVEVGRTANAFRRYRCDLSPAARVGENTLCITFLSAPREAAALQKAQPYYVPYIAGNCPIPHGNMLRKTACDFGWDWNIALAPFGLTGFMRVEPQGPRIDRLAIAQDHRADGMVALDLVIHTAQAVGAPFRVEFDGQSFTGNIAGAETPLRIIVAQPRLWWPQGQGGQQLYDLQVTVGTRLETRRIGLRDIRLITTPDAKGTRFAFSVNGREVFAKGANWIPADALMGRVTPEGIYDLLLSATQAHMNMIRVWGGGRYEHPAFYAACDELGLMVWQDFMFACNLYPATPDFLSEVAAEVRDQVARLHHHACLALWCGDNELVGALTWFEESRNNRDRYLVAYDRLNRVIEENLKAVDPRALWWPSSPSAGPLDFGDAWHDDGKGDMHFWSVWHEGRDFDHYRDVAPRFCSEFGFQSYPSMDVIARFTTPADRNIAAPVFESHQKNAGGNARIAETMFRYFRWPSAFADFVWLSQIQQGLAIKTAVSQWRSLKPHCMGTLYWQLNDTWPVCSWSSLDHGGGWKLLHHMARRFYAPVTVSAVPDQGGVQLRGVNDTGHEVTLLLRARAMDMAGGLRDLATAKAALGAEAVTMTTLPPDALHAGEVLVFDWHSLDGAHHGRDIHTPQPWKAYDLPDSRLSLEVIADGPAYRLRVHADAAAFFVTLSADVAGRFSDNAFHLLGRETAEITFTPALSGALARFGLRDLRAATGPAPALEEENPR